MGDDRDRLSPVIWRWWCCKGWANWCSPTAIPERLKAQGAVEIGAGHYPLIVLLHIAVAVGDPVASCPQPTRDLLAACWRSSCCLQACARLGDRSSLGPYLDHPHHFRARRAAGHARALSLRPPSQLPGGGGRDSGSAAGVRRNRGGDLLFRSPMPRFWPGASARKKPAS